MLDEIGQDIKDFALQLDWRTNTAQFVELLVEFVVSKEIAHGEENIPSHVENVQGCRTLALVRLSFYSLLIGV
jgi:hypothetical protein